MKHTQVNFLSAVPSADPLNATLIGYVHQSASFVRDLDVYTDITAAADGDSISVYVWAYASWWLLAEYPVVEGQKSLSRFSPGATATAFCVVVPDGVEGTAILATGSFR